MTARSYLTGVFIAFIIIANVQAADIVIDGILNESAWQETPENTINYQVFPQTLKQTNSNFSYRVITTKSGIFLGLKANTQHKLRIRTQENDIAFSNDHFQIMLDMHNNAQESYVFAINHQGNYFDGIFGLNEQLDLDWNAQWQYKIRTSQSHWVAEVYIPWHVMPFSIAPENQFGLYVSRFDESSNATYASIPANASMNSLLQQFSKYSVIINNESNFNIFPYLSLNRDILHNDNKASIGAEIFWQPTKAQRISAAINPDFGQVESNELVVNFSALESFFSEKRPFFTENQNLFNVNGPETLNLVHSPRIGGESIYDPNYKSELNSALKYTINFADFDLGMLTAFEDNSTTGNGRDFYALRGQYTDGANKLGVSLNHVNTPAIERQSTVVSSDLHYAFSANTAINLGFIQAKIVEHDIQHSDMGWWITGSTDIAEQHSHEFSLFAYGDNLQLNDMGFVKRVNRKQFEYEYQYQIPNLNSEIFRDITLVFETELKTNFQNEALPNVIGTGIELVTNNEFEYQLSIEVLSAGFDDLITRGNQSLWLPASQQITLEMASAEYLWGTYNLEFSTGREGWRGRFYHIQTSLAQQYQDNLHVSLVLAQYNSDSWLDWDQKNTVSEYNYTEQSIELNIDFQISRQQELRLKFEAVIGKAENLGSYVIQHDGLPNYAGSNDDFSFTENAFQLRYKYSLSKLTAFYLSYSFAGEFEDEFAQFGKRNLYKQTIESKNAHNIFAKIRLAF